MALGVDFAAQPSVSRCAYDKSPVRMHLYPPRVPADPMPAVVVL
jgi:hypothetical protein